MVYSTQNAGQTNKHGVNMWLYGSEESCTNASVAYQETETGHSEEFLHEKSAFVFYIIEGIGTWIIEDKEYQVKATDVVIVPPLVSCKSRQAASSIAHCQWPVKLLLREQDVKRCRIR